MFSPHAGTTLLCSCCSRDAEGQETRVTIDIAGEGFTATGLMVTEVRAAPKGITCSAAQCLLPNLLGRLHQDVSLSTAY